MANNGTQKLNVCNNSTFFYYAELLCASSVELIYSNGTENTLTQIQNRKKYFSIFVVLERLFHLEILIS